MRLAGARERVSVKQIRLMNASNNALELDNNALALDVSKLQESIQSWKEAWFRQRAATGTHAYNLYRLVMLIRKLMLKEPNAYSDRIAALYSFVRRIT